MTLLNPQDSAEAQVAKQAKIIDALIKRANRQSEVGLSAYSAFQSAIELQEQVAAQSRDLERAATELQSVQYERARTRRNLVEALSSMEEGFALFAGGQLDICNDLFQNVLPDISDQVIPGLPLERFFDLMTTSTHLVSTDKSVSWPGTRLERDTQKPSIVYSVIELRQDRWYQMSVQQTSSSNMVLLLTEITELVRQNRTEKETLIDRQADYLQAVFQNMSSGMCTLSPSGEVMMQNARFRELFGVPLKVLKQGTPLKRVLEFMEKNGLIGASTMGQVRHWQRELKENRRFSTRVRHVGGRVLDIQANMLPDGGVLLKLEDVTQETRTTETLENRVLERTAELTRANARLTEQFEEKARVEEELRLAKERAEAAVSSKTRFLAAASHDLLQPINAAKLLISTLKETVQQTPFTPLVDRLEGAFVSTEQLLHSLLDISRLDSNESDAVTPSVFCLGPMMEGIFADQTAVAEEKNVRLSGVSSSVFVRSDQVFLLRSVQNLVVNAIQYTQPGGRVLVGCRRRGEKVTIEVWDTGIGIAAKDQARIFDEFTRAGDVPLGTGVGLGLSVVDRACRHLNHRLWVRSKPGQGSVFSIEMDIVGGAHPEIVPRGPIYQSNGMPLDHIVLVIENDADVLFAFTQRLERWGASVLAAHSIDEALKHVRDMGIAPDIILADYQLDYGDTGVHAIAAIRCETGRQVPAIVITADRSDNLHEIGANNDFSVMTKPVKLSRLRPMIDWKISGGLPLIGQSTGSAENTDKSWP